MTFQEQCDQYVDIIEKGLRALLPQEEVFCADEHMPQLLSEAMRYSLLAGGKRVRPVLMLAAAKMLGVPTREIITSACALEMIHTYSLIHDDLPGMDNDDYRRGKLTNHKVYGAGQAILAGDGLLNYAYECMLSDALNYPENLRGHLAAAMHIARRAGVTGMVAGQCIDLQCENGAHTSAETLAYIHRHKTADLLTAPLEAACDLAGASDEARNALLTYGRNIGLAFQIEDDLLDIEGDCQTLGKQTGMDAQRGKMTWPALYGVEESREMMEKMWRDARTALCFLGDRAAFLNGFIDFLRERKN